MGMRNLRRAGGALLAGGRAPDTPAAAVMNGTTAATSAWSSRPSPSCRSACVEAGLGAPAVVVVGDVVRLRAELAWFEALPLFGRACWSRARREQAGALCRALEAAGAEPVLVPMIRIERR